MATRKAHVKPARPLEMKTWTETGRRYIHQTKFSSDHKQLERDWANRFAELWNRKNPADQLAVDPDMDFDDPADLWLRTGVGQRIDLQVVEAVDAQRLAREAFKRYAQKALLDADSDETRALIAALSGMQIVLTEHTPIDLLPKNNRQARKEVLGNMRAALWACVRAASLMPDPVCNYEVSSWRTFRVCEGMEMMLHASRYASANLGMPFKFLWIVGDVVKDDPPRYFEAAVASKLDMRYTAGGRELWLLVYSADCTISLEEERHIWELVAGRAHQPFSRILVVDAGLPAQVYPPVDNSTSLTDYVPSMTMRVASALPDLYDDRWVQFPLKTLVGYLARYHSTIC